MDFLKFKAASVAASPILFDLSRTIDKCCRLIEEAADHGTKLVVFPETFIPTYPWWLWMATSNTKRLELYKQLFKSSVVLNGQGFKKICKTAKENQTFVVVGINEIDGMTLYNTQVFIDDQGEIIGRRRKLIPTGEERSVWGRGDGSDLFVCDTAIGKLSGLICYENTMALSRYALYDLGAQIHIASWPGDSFRGQPRDRVDVIDLTSKYIAFEGQMFVIASSAHLGEDELAFYKELDPTIEGAMTTGGGLAGIISPFGEYVSPPVKDEEGIAYGEIDLEIILDSKHMVDSVGHYARGDVTKLIVNRENTSPVEFKSGQKNVVGLTREADDEDL